MSGVKSMTNEELLAIANGSPVAKEPTGPAKLDMSKLSNEQLLKIATGDDGLSGADRWAKEAGDSVMNAVVKVGKKIDSYTGAPSRSAVYALQSGENPFKAFGSNFGGDADKAPTGKMIAEKAGLSTDEYINTPFKNIDGSKVKASPAGIAGFGVDVATDWTNVVPVGALAKATGKGIAKGSALAGKAAVMGADLATGTKLASGTIDATKEIGASAKLAFDKLVNPKQAADFGEFAAIAEKNGIDPKVLPESVEFGQQSFISRGARNLAEGPVGEADLLKFQDSLAETMAATDRKIADIARGPVLSKQEAGVYIRQAFDKSIDDFFNRTDVTHNQIIKQYPGLKLTTGYAAGDAHVAKLESALNGLENFASGRVRRGITQAQRAQGQGLLNSVNAIRESNGSYKQTVEALRDIGDAAFKNEHIPGAIPADIAKMRKLYGDVNDALIQTVRKNVGDDVAEQLIKSNKEITEFLSDKNPLAKIIQDPSLSPESVFRNIVENGDSRKIQALKNVIGEENMQPIKGAWIDSIVKRDLEDGFSFRQVAGTIKNKRHVMENVLSPDEAKDFIDLIRLGDRHGTPILSTSGTGASSLFSNIKSGVESAILNKTFINSAKARARGAASAESSLGYAPKSIAVPEQSLSGTPRSLGPLERSRLERAMKGAQVISSQDENRKEKQNAFQRKLEKKNP